MTKSNPENLNKYLIKLKKSWVELDNLINLSNNWADIVGKDLEKECKPLKIEKNILTISANHPEWRQALIYNKHKLKESINKLGFNLKNIKIVQNYQDDHTKNRLSDNNYTWENHPSRVKNNKFLQCSICKRPTPIGEIKRWGKCTFCWRETL